MISIPLSVRNVLRTLGLPLLLAVAHNSTSAQTITQVTFETALSVLGDDGYSYYSTSTPGSPLTTAAGSQVGAYLNLSGWNPNVDTYYWLRGNGNASVSYPSTGCVHPAGGTTGGAALMSSSYPGYATTLDQTITWQISFDNQSWTTAAPAITSFILRLEIPTRFSPHPA